MAQSYADYCSKELDLKLTEAEIVSILSILNFDSWQHCEIGQKLAKFTSKEWRNVYNEAMKVHIRQDAS